jgi:alpha-mannosidase
MTKVTYVPKPRYENPLAQQLGLGLDDLKREAKLARLLEDLQGKIRTPIQGGVAWHFSEAECTGALPLPDNWQQWPLLTPRSVWGTTQKHTWLVAEITIPDNAKGGTFAINVTSNWRAQQGSTDPQCLAYLDGKIAQAIDGNHTVLVIARNAVPGDVHLIQINAFTFDERPMVGFQTDLMLRDDRIESLFHDLATAFEVAIRLPQTDGRRHTILRLVEQSLYALDRREGQPDGLTASLPDAEKIAREIQGLAREEMQPIITAFGHTHLDVAWLWRVKHVRDKTARSFATALDLMAEFPEFVFMYNQPVLFNYLKQDYPELWERVKEKVRDGQFEIDGAMWVEPDVNISSGEALVRQIMRGQQFHIEEFGIMPKSVWLPDTFGYSAALPQILTKSGIEFFVTSKLSWNDTDRQPYDSFFWRGIDGSKVKSQLITTQATEASHQKTVYNSKFTVSDILGTWKRYEPKSLHDEVMICYGHGDGGGGPTRDMVQRGIRLERGIPGAPKLRMEGLRPYLDRLGAKMDARKDDFPIWNGELYLQYHRGTLTAVAKNKTNNRLAERAMRELEFVTSVAALTTGSDYPRNAIRDLWDIVLLNQFHDILPGTSIAPVYADSDADYAELFAAMHSTQGPLQSALNKIFPPQNGQLSLVNFTGQVRDGELVRFHADTDLTGSTIRTMSGESALQSIVRADGGTSFAAPVPNIPALGWSGAQLIQTEAAPASTLSVSKTHLENALIAIQFDEGGEITSIIDKTMVRELIQPGKRANQLIAYEDKPKAYDAWDIDHYFEEKSWRLSDSPATIEVVETGPHRAALRIDRHYARSRIVQVISLQDGQKQIEFDTKVDWQERQTLLKTGFPFDLNVSETRAEIQFGHVKRPSHKNTSWDQARFETSMHRWVDMSEPDFGAALLNDCKYGYDAVEQTVRLTLLKGPNMPDPNADLGVHRFRYALLLHQGEQDLHHVVRAAERFNNPIMVHGPVETGATEQRELEKAFSFASADTASLTIETVKLSEVGNDAIVRIFEHANRRFTSRINFGLPVAHVAETDLMEHTAGPSYDIDSNAVELTFRPFEIKTLKVTFSDPPSSRNQ